MYKDAVAEQASKQMPVILACPGSGKTYYSTHSPLWEDQDVLMKSLHDRTWHQSSHTPAEEKAHYEQLDAKLAVDTQKHYIVGSLFWEFVPDAIVVVPDKVLRRRVAKRPDISYEATKRVEAFLVKLAAKHRVPLFSTFEAASLHILNGTAKKNKNV